jgi:hypothetical protein
MYARTHATLAADLLHAQVNTLCKSILYADSHQSVAGCLFTAQAASHQHVRGEYEFAQSNPFLGDPAALEKGKDLFKRGLLSEAALALEAEVGLASAEGWAACALAARWHWITRVDCCVSCMQGSGCDPSIPVLCECQQHGLR